MSTPTKRTTVSQPTRSRSKPKTQLQRTRTKTTDKSPTKSRKLPTRTAVVSPAESGQTSRPRAARKTTSYLDDIDLSNLFDSDSDEEEKATMSEAVVPPPTNHEIETVERSSIERSMPANAEEKQVEAAFKAACELKFAEREPAPGHDVPLTRNLTETEMEQYRRKFRQAFPHATPAMLEEVNEVLRQEAHPDADAKLPVIELDVRTKPTPKGQTQAGYPAGLRSEHCFDGVGYPHLPSREVALYALSYLTFHRLIRDTCLIITKDSCKRKPNCQCLSHLCIDFRGRLHTLGGKDDVVAVKLFKIAVIPMLTELIETQRIMFDGVNDEAAFDCFVYGKIFVRSKNMQNNTPHQILEFAGKDHEFCLSIVIELFGRTTSQAAVQKFVHKWITPTDDYFQKIIRVRGLQSKLTRCLLEYTTCGSGRLKSWKDMGEGVDGHFNELKLPKLFFSFLQEAGIQLGDVQSSTFEEHMRNLRCLYDPMVEAQVLVVAHSNFGQQTAGTLSSILFNLEGKLSYCSAANVPVQHTCDGGTVYLGKPVPFLDAILEGFIGKAGPGGRKNLNAPPHHHQRPTQRK